MARHRGRAINGIAHISECHRVSAREDIRVRTLRNSCCAPAATFPSTSQKKVCSRVRARAPKKIDLAKIARPSSNLVMADQPILKPDLNVVADRLLAVHTQVQSIRDVIRDTARQLDPSGKPTAAARKARNQLRNPEGNTTRLSSVVKSMLGPDGAAKQVKLLEEKTEALAKLNQAAFDVIQSDGALYAFETLSQIYKQEDTEHPSRKRGKDDLCLSAEVIRFAQRLTERRAPIYILDQFTEGEMDMFGAMIAEKAAAAKHGAGTVWGRAFEGGFLEVAMEDITEDQRAAILSARGRIDKDAGAIYRALCEATGRKLDISPTFAASVFTLMSDEDLGPGLITTT